MAPVDYLKKIEICFATGDLEGAKAVVRHLQDAHEQCHTLLTQANDAIVVFSVRDFRIVEFNPRASGWFGYSPDELRESSLLALHPADEQEALKNRYHQVSAQGPQTLTKAPVVRKDGRRLWADISAARYDTGSETLIQGIFHDVTELYRLYGEVEARARELEIKNTQLEEAQTMQSEFLALISHELRTPLNSIIGYNSLLEEGVYGELQAAQHKATQRIDRNATRLLTLINQLIELSRLKAGVISLFPEEVDLVTVVREVLEDYQVSAEEKGLALDLSHPYQGVRVTVDRDKIREVLRQLISNAIQFTPQGKVTIEIRREGDRGVVRVSDTGPGIDPARRDSLFGIFRPGERRYDGGGLGLAIVKRLADLMRVEIELESQAGVGSAFAVRIPPAAREENIRRETAAVAEIKLPEPKFLPIEQTAREVLIVDDDPYTVEMLSDFLESRGGLKVQKAYSGMHGMIYLAQSCPDYLLVDLLMPQINGERVIQYCRELWGDRVRIIVITGKDLSPSERRSLEEKTDALIHKGKAPYKSLTKALEEIMPIRARA